MRAVQSCAMSNLGGAQAQRHTKTQADSSRWDMSAMQCKFRQKHQSSFSLAAPLRTSLKPHDPGSGHVQVDTGSDAFLYVSQPLTVLMLIDLPCSYGMWTQSTKSLCHSLVERRKSKAGEHGTSEKSITRNSALASSRGDLTTTTYWCGTDWHSFTFHDSISPI